MTPEALLNALRWRYAVKKFDPTKRIPDATWDALEESLVLTASSYGLQPWRFVVVDDPALRTKLQPASWNQAQITQAHRLVVFAGRKDFGTADIARFVARTAEVRGMPVEALSKFRDMMAKDLTNRTAAAREAWVNHQVYIALGGFLTAAAALGVDACPMEGIDPAQYDRLLGLPEAGYATVVAATAGYRAADDRAAAIPKIRFCRPEVVVHL